VRLIGDFNPFFLIRLFISNCSISSWSQRIFVFNLAFFNALILQRQKSCQLASDQQHIWSSTGEEQPGSAATGKWAGKREISSLQMKDDSCP